MSTPISTLVEEVKAFGTAMVYKLGLHRNKGHWSGKSDKELLEHLRDEVRELEDACRTGKREDIASEAADVANLSMMIYSNAVNGSKDHGKTD